VPRFIYTTHITLRIYYEPGGVQPWMTGRTDICLAQNSVLAVTSQTRVHDVFDFIEASCLFTFCIGHTYYNTENI